MAGQVPLIMRSLSCGVTGEQSVRKGWMRMRKRTPAVATRGCGLSDAITPPTCVYVWRDQILAVPLDGSLMMAFYR